MHLRLTLQCVAAEVTQAKRPDPHNPGATTPCLQYTYRFKGPAGLTSSDLVVRTTANQDFAVGDEITLDLTPLPAELSRAA